MQCMTKIVPWFLRSYFLVLKENIFFKVNKKEICNLIMSMVSCYVAESSKNRLGNVVGIAFLACYLIKNVTGLKTN